MSPAPETLLSKVPELGVARRASPARLISGAEPGAGRVPTPDASAWGAPGKGPARLGSQGLAAPRGRRPYLPARNPSPDLPPAFRLFPLLLLRAPASQERPQAWSAPPPNLLPAPCLNQPHLESPSLPSQFVDGNPLSAARSQASWLWGPLGNREQKKKLVLTGRRPAPPKARCLAPAACPGPED